MNTFNEANKILFSQLIENSPEGIILTDKNLTTYINGKAREFFNIKANQDLPIDMKSIFPENFVQEIENNYSKISDDTSYTFSFENNYNKLNYSVSIYPINFEGKDVSMISVEQKSGHKADENLTINHREHFLPYAETDSAGRIILCNKHFINIIDSNIKIKFGYTKLSDIFSVFDHSDFDTIFKNKTEKEFPERLELKLKSNYNEEIVYRMYYFPEYKNNEIGGTKCLFLDISEDLKIEKKYNHNQQRLRKILDLVPQMIFLRDENGQIMMANKSGAEFYKTTIKDIVYKNMSIFHKNIDELNEILTEDQMVIKSKEVYEWREKGLTDMDGKKQFFNITKVPYQEKDSEKVYSLGIVQNVTQQRFTELEKEEANEKYRLLVEKGSDGILIIQENKIVFGNDQAARILGKNIDEIVGFSVTSFIPKNQIKSTLIKYKTNLQNRITEDHYNLKLSKPDKSNVYLEISINSINYQGKKARIVFARDITKRRLAELQSEKNRNLLEQAQKIANLGSWEWDLVNNKLYCSDEIYRILGVENDPTENRDIRWIVSFIPGRERRKIYRGFVAAFRSGLRYETDFPAFSADGEMKIIHSQSMVNKNSTNNPVSIIGTWLDITERIKTEQLLKEAKIKAEESDKLKSAFLANMSHEIRTPMNAVLGFASLLKRADLEEKTRQEYIEHILHSGENLIKLINDIVDISKIESNQLEIEKCPVRLNELLEQVFNRYEELLLIRNKMDIALEMETAIPDPDFTIITDPFRLQQVLSNLLNNAIKFTTKGEIKFGYSIAKSELLFFVQDQGIGIPHEKYEEIFERFSKLDDPQRMNKSGAGLGLSISKSLVNMLGGNIWIDKNLGSGSKFCFTLPLEMGKKEAKTIKRGFSSESSQNFDLKGKTILIAEDETLNYKLLESMLNKSGAKILWAKNGLEAIKMTVSNKVDLIFMDIKMPEMDGYEATKQIKKIEPSIPIIAQTAFAFANERNFILQSGCDMYLTKPIDQTELWRTLKIFISNEN